MQQPRAFIRGIASYLPEATLTNQQLASEFGADWTPAKILDKTGINVRHIAGPDECASDLGVAAARRFLDSGVCTADQIDFLIFCTQTPDHVLPATACLIQARLGLRKSCGALDINQGCSGFVYGLSLAKGLVASGAASNVLLITGDTYSKLINPGDRSVRAIFGDGAAATLVSGAPGDREYIGPFVFGTDGGGAKHLIVPAGGTRLPRSPQTGLSKEAEGGNRRSDQDLYMNGPEIFSFTLQVVPDMVKELSARSGLGLERIDHFVLHQANRFMLDHLRRKIGIPENRFPVHLADCGNTVSSTIPLTLERERKAGRIQPGHKVMLLGFGVGLSWAGTIVEFH